ncbi:MAG: FAD-dependent oxidoreductase, partial [Ktedonobacteraceae bacterium]|nr:FAD-dependent oxidoreductase [Ktedonobacteraceae bacterium]
MSLVTATTQRSRQSGRHHALVIGASIAGLLAARSLADYFDQVTIVERDSLPEAPQVRKGIPQGRHVHGLLNRGMNIIGEFFPDIFQSLEADGALQLDVTKDVSWFHFGAWKQQFPGSLRMSVQSRPLLEYHVRRRLADQPNIRLLDNCEIFGLVSEAHGRTRITGACLRHHDTSNEEDLMTNLVVDASGRGSQTPRWLTALSYPPVTETQIKIGVGYASRLYRRPEGISPNQLLFIYPEPPETKRLGILFPIEGNAWIATLSGYAQDNPPADETGFLTFARSLARPTLYNAIKDAEPLSPIAI